MLPRLLRRRRIPLLLRSPSQSFPPSPPFPPSPRLSFHLLPTLIPILPSALRFHSNSPSSSSSVPTHAEPTLQLTFTCTADNCGHRSTHTFTKRSYQSGIVLLQCPGCKSRHLIADHIGWFNESTQNGMFKTVEDLLRVKGELVQRGKIYDDGTIEILPEKDERDPKP